MKAEGRRPKADGSGDVGRRRFLKVGAAAAAATAVACGAPAGRWRAISEDEARTLAAACDQIVPPDQDPGAADAGVVTFIDRQLATRRRRDLPVWRAGLVGLDRSARRAHGARFADLEAAKQEDVLRAIEKGSVEAADWDGVTPTAFFQRLRDYSMMGFYGDPRHGGNRNRVSWKMLGVPDPPVRGRLHETPPPPALAPRSPSSAPAASPRSSARTRS